MLAFGAAQARADEGRTLMFSTEGRAAASLPSFAGDGRWIAFVRGGDVFVHDRRDGSDRLASLSNAGVRANGDSSTPSLSADGRFVAFTSFASNLSVLERAHAPHLFVRDLRADVILAVGHPERHKRGNEWPSLPVLSGDGGALAWITRASNLVPNDTNTALDVYVYDLRSWRTSRVTVATSGAEADGDSATYSLSHDGRHVAFASQATNLAGDDHNDAFDVFVHDRERHTTVRLSRPVGGGDTDGHSDYPAISADGRFVAFASDATNLVPDDRNDARDIFVHHRASGRTTRVSLSSHGAEADGGSDFPSISGDARFVAFASRASNLVPDDENGVSDVFVHDRHTGRTVRASVAYEGSEADDESGSNEVEISTDGSCVLFDSFASNLAPGDADAGPAFYVRELRPPPWRARGAPDP